MNATRRFLLATAFAASLALPAFAAEPYVTAKTFDLAILLPLPPVAGSAVDKADMQAVLDAQAQASDARKKMAFEDSEESVYLMFTRVLGDKFTAANTPKLAAMFERIAESEGETLDPVKPIFGRVRPWIANPDVKAIAKPTKSQAYPSGHTTLVTITAIVVAGMVPEKRREIWARAYEYAESRVIGGMHFPSDIEAGLRSGTAIAGAMFALPGFQADYAAARAEVRSALGL
jgi:acid phosphatase (class A)